MPASLRIAICATLLLLSACGGEGPEPGAVSWDPPLDDGETSTTRTKGKRARQGSAEARRALAMSPSLAPDPDRAVPRTRGSRQVRGAPSTAVS